MVKAYKLTVYIKVCILIYSLCTILSLILFGCKPNHREITIGNSYTNGNWYDGSEFNPENFYVVDGYLTFKKPDSIINIYDLKNGFVIPPFGEAHNHNLDRKWQLEFLPQAYLNEGTFYYQALTSRAKQVNELRSYFENDSTLDVKFAQQGFTSTLGHPFMAYEPSVMGLGYDNEVWKKNMSEIIKSRIDENNAYIFIDSISQIEEKLNIFYESQPDIAKIYLMDVANFESNYNIPGQHGLTEEVARVLVKKLHEKNFTVYAHIETAYDFNLAAEIGVDCVAHMPGYIYDGLEENKNIFFVEDSIIQKAIKNNMKVIPTVAIGINRVGVKDSITKVNFVKDFIRRFKDAGGIIALGSDRFNETLSFEIDAIIKLNFLSNNEILQILTYNTPKLIFPNRKIGELKEGFEASFLVLNDNPLNNIQNIKNIKFMIKKGNVLIN